VGKRKGLRDQPHTLKGRKAMNEPVVITRAGTLPRIWSFVHDDETPLEALNNCIDDCLKWSKQMLENVTKYPENADYWKERQATYEREAQTAEVIEYEDFAMIERECILQDKPAEITEEKYNEMLDILPPLYYTTHNGYTMFCMREMWTASYTTQYAYHRATGKYYSCMVDASDRSTWICERIKTN
jgi:hypothetical protein